MRVTHALVATAAAMFLTVGAFAQAQQTTPGAGEPARPGAQSPTTPPSAAAPSDQSTASLPRGTLHEIKDDKAMVTGLNVSLKDLTGMDIYGSDGKKIGDVNKVLGDNANAIKAVTVDVGGFLGMGAREVVLPIEKLQKGTEKDRLTVSMTKEDIEKLDRWEDDRGAGRTPPPAR